MANSNESGASRDTSSNSSTRRTSQRTHRTSTHTTRTFDRSTKTTHTLHPPETTYFPAESRTVPASASVPLSHAASSFPALSSVPPYSSFVPGPASTTARASSSSTTPPHVPAPSPTTPSGAFPPHHHHSNDNNGLSAGEVAAAVVVPILAVAALAALLFCFLRRRRRRRRPSSRPSSGEGLTPADREMSVIVPGSENLKKAEVTITNDNAATVNVVTASHNNAYLTGIDSDVSSPTSMRGYDNMGQSRGGSVEPPPPYRGRASSSMTATSTTVKDNSSSAHVSTDYNTSVPDADAAWGPPTVSANQPWSYDVQPLAMPDFGSRFDPLSTEEATNSNFRSPVSPLEQEDHEMKATLWQPPRAPGLQNQPQLSRTHSAQSITSTLYSESASVHSAHQAAPVRCSVIASAGGHGRADSGASRGSHAHSRYGSDPFTDPPSPP